MFSHWRVVDRDMVWKFNSMNFKAPISSAAFWCWDGPFVLKSFVFRLLIFKQHGWAIKPKRCYWMIASLYRKYIVFTNTQVYMNVNKKIEQRLSPIRRTLYPTVHKWSLSNRLRKWLQPRSDFNFYYNIGILLACLQENLLYWIH